MALAVCGRRGGERITLPGRAHSHALKKVLQEQGVPSWERERLPLVFADDGELLAAGDRVISARLQRSIMGAFHFFKKNSNRRPSA